MVVESDPWVAAGCPNAAQPELSTISESFLRRHGGIGKQREGALIAFPRERHAAVAQAVDAQAVIQAVILAVTAGCAHLPQSPRRPGSRLWSRGIPGRLGGRLTSPPRIDSIL